MSTTDASSGTNKANKIAGQYITLILQDMGVEYVRRKKYIAINCPCHPSDSMKCCIWTPGTTGDKNTRPNWKCFTCETCNSKEPGKGYGTGLVGLIFALRKKFLKQTEIGETFSYIYKFRTPHGSSGLSLFEDMAEAPIHKTVGDRNCRGRQQTRGI